MKNTEAPLSIQIVDDELIIRIGIGTLAFCFENMEDNNPWNELQHKYIRDYSVIDKLQFAKDIVHELENEEEDGTTPVDLLFDSAMRGAMENGSLGLSDPE